MLPLHPEVVDLLYTRYDVLDVIDLLRHDLNNTDRLIKVLAKYQDYKFNEDQRLIILHHDTDYYLHNSFEGNTMFNVFSLISSFNIACEKILFITNNYGIETEISHLAKTICNSESPEVLYTALWLDFPRDIDVRNTEVVDENINYTFCCLNGAQRQHRLLTLCYLQDLDLLKHGIVSYHFKK